MATNPWYEFSVGEEYVAGTKIRAADVNQQFNDLEAALDSVDTAINGKLPTSAGAVGTTNLADGAATDVKVGNRTITDTSVSTGNTGTLTNLVSWLGNMIKQITGKSSWRTAPATTLETANTHHNASAPHSGHAALAGNGSQTFSVGTATSAAHAVRKDQHDTKMDKSGGTFTGTVNLLSALDIKPASGNAGIELGNPLVGSSTPFIDFKFGTGVDDDWNVRLINKSTRVLDFQGFGGTATIQVDGNVIWHSGNDGTGSGLDADFLDGYSTSLSATANTVAVRDSGGRISIGAAISAADAVRFDQEASPSAKGLVTTGTQTFGGIKSFNAEKVGFPINPGGLRFHKVTISGNSAYTHDQIVTSGIIIVRSIVQTAIFLADEDAASSSKLAGHSNWKVGDPGASTSQMGVEFINSSAFKVWNRFVASQTVYIGILVAQGTP